LSPSAIVLQIGSMKKNARTGGSTGRALVALALVLFAGHKIENVDQRPDKAS